MCGIAGIIETQRLADISAIRHMCDVIAHRGPDGEGIHVDGLSGFGMRRLAIIDVAGGSQPIFNEDKSAWIVYNGETYNHQALRSRLEQAGHVYQTHSDTEGILHAYDEFGEAC